jgi:hypothetical protein
VTVAVSIAVAAWMGALTFGNMGTSTIKITAVAFSGVSEVGNNTIILTMKNDGTKQVTIGAVKVNHNLCSFNGTTSLASGDIGKTLTVWMGSSFWTNGNDYQVDLFDSNGQGVGSTQEKAHS